MRTRVKMCGFTEPLAIAAAVSAGVDSIGLVLDPSPRQLSLDQAAELMAQIPPGVATVAVVGRPSLQELRQIHERLAPSWIQIMADALPSPAEAEGLRLIPAFEDSEDLVARVEAYLEQSADALPLVLVDGPRPGSGIRADWSRVLSLVPQTRLMLAGGIRADNVAEAIAKVGPYGVDLSSGIERERGIKDPQMVREFMAALRAAEVGE